MSQLYAQHDHIFDVYSILYGHKPYIIEYLHVYLILYETKSSKIEYTLANFHVYSILYGKMPSNIEYEII